MKSKLEKFISIGADKFKNFISIMRSSFWPINSNELKKFIPMILILFGALFSYTIVRTIKDTLLVNIAPEKGQILPWAKVFFVTPGSVLFVLAYAKLSNICSRERLFLYTLIPFLAFIGLFAFVLYPAHDVISMSVDSMHVWRDRFPFLAPFVTLFGCWSYTIFYVMAEIWGNVGISVLFWQFANQITTTTEAKRFYPLFGLWSNLGLICAGLLLKYAEDVLAYFAPAGSDVGFSMQLKVLCAFSVLGGVLMGVVYVWMHRYVLTDSRYYNEASLVKKGKEPKPKMSIGESFRFLIHSKYLGYIAVLVLAYGISINLVEVSWKSAVSEYFKGNRVAYTAFMGNQFIYTGIVTMALIASCQSFIRIFGWRVGAIITPLVSMITGGLFFVFLLCQDQPFIANVCAFLDMAPLYLAILLGLAQNCLTKGAKYSVFDPTKEMAYIPLDEEMKVKGKAAIDIIGGRAGKSGGGLINMVWSTAFMGSVSGFFSAVWASLMLVSVWWIWAVNRLAKLYNQKVTESGEK